MSSCLKIGVAWKDPCSLNGVNPRSRNSLMERREFLEGKWKKMTEEKRNGRENEKEMEMAWDEFVVSFIGFG